MDILREWAMTIAGVVVFGSICEMILPASSFQKYVRLTIGLILILTMLTPIKELLYNDMDFREDLLPAESYQQRETMEITQTEDVLRVYRYNLNTKIKAAIQARYQDMPIKVQCDVQETDEQTFGVIEKVLVFVDAQYDADVSQKIKEILGENFGVDAKKITIRYLKESNQ